MRRPIIAGNWKMHKNAAQAVALVQELAALTIDVGDRDILVCPPFPCLYQVADALQGTGILLGAQNMHWEEKGAYTGEVAPDMLVAAGCSYVILGHSERRQYFGEKNATINHKLQAAFKHGLTPIMCVGESLDQREAGETEAYIGVQVKEGMEHITKEQAASMVIAYEPIWAIGTGLTASAGEANAVCRFIRNTIAAIFGEDAAAMIRIQYGGSVKPNNIFELMAQSDIDGALVGGASLEAVDFAALIKY